jgi:thiamine biosynthesis lipoprotein
MGTFVEITVLGVEERKAGEAIDAAFAEVDKVNELMSSYIPQSQVSRISRMAGLKALPADSSLLEILQEAERYSKLSGGAFDVTVGPLIKLWGFYKKEGKTPASEEIAEARNIVGYENISVDLAEGTVYLAKKGMLLDLGGIAKGWAVDRAVEKLKELGIRDALINAGGDIYALGDKSGNNWTIGVRKPDNTGIYCKVAVADRAVVTSGCYERYLKVNGERHCHIINPGTGMPVKHFYSVTVIAGNAADADALATSVMVMGAEKGIDLLEKIPGLEGMILFPSDEKTGAERAIMTNGFKKYILKQ